jgi:hypothetical protein
VIKATSIDPSIVDPDGVYRHTGPARVFTREEDAIAAIRESRIAAGDVIVLAGAGPSGTGMEETYQLTSALKHLPFGKHVALLTDARFSGVSTGACIGHIGPEALQGGPIGRLRDGDRIRIVIDRVKLDGRIDFIGEGAAELPPDEAARILANRQPHPSLAPTLLFPPIPNSGPLSRPPAAARGAAASTTPTKSSPAFRNNPNSTARKFGVPFSTQKLCVFCGDARFAFSGFGSICLILYFRPSRRRCPADLSLQ